MILKTENSIYSIFYKQKDVNYSTETKETN